MREIFLLKMMTFIWKGNINKINDGKVVDEVSYSFKDIQKMRVSNVVLNNQDV